MLDALILAILPNLSTAFLQDQHRSDRPATEAPLNVERRELAAIQLLLGAERKYSEAKERLVALETRLAGRTEADARSLLAEVQTLLGDPAKARRKLGWRPRVAFRKLVAEMAREDLKAAERDALVSRHGYRAYSGRE